MNHLVLIPLSYLALSTCLAAQDPRLKTIEVSKGIYMLEGNGGNLGLCVGGDGAFLIDDQFAPMVPQIRAAVAKLSKLPVKFLVNTHHHGDHTGGNERLGRGGAIIYAHDNVRKRMTADQLRKKIQGRAAAALPVVTFSTSLRFHWNGESIHAFHVDAAHTDGDAIIHFEKANVFHMGDVFFNGRFPFLDLRSGGSLVGMVAAVERVLKLADDKSMIIPGHGALATRTDLQDYHRMLVTVRDSVTKLVVAGKTEQQVLDSGPARQFDKRWAWGFINGEKFVKTVYTSVRLTRSAAKKAAAAKAKGR